MNHPPLKRRTHRPVVHVWVVMATLAAIVCGTQRSAWALDCEGRLVSEGQASWEVQAICGEPSHIQDTVEVILQPVYGPFGRVVDYLPVAVPKSVWTYNFGSNRLVYVLTFREGKLAHIETGGYGH